MKFNGISFEWPGYATIRLETEAGYVVYLDPGRLDYGVLIDHHPRDADAVLITHTHHYDPGAIRHVSNDDTIVYVFEDVVELNNLANREKSDLEAPFDLPYVVQSFEYLESFQVNGLHVDTVPAYNLSSPEGLHIRPDGKGFQRPGTCVGFLLTIDETTVFWPSDSDFIEEHRDLEVDVLLPPISQAVTMDRLEAVELVEALTPELVIPVHYKWLDKTPDGPLFLTGDPEAFREDVTGLGIRCEIIT